MDRCENIPRRDEADSFTSFRATSSARSDARGAGPCEGDAGRPGVDERVFPRHSVCAVCAVYKYGWK